VPDVARYVELRRHTEADVACSRGTVRAAANGDGVLAVEDDGVARVEAFG
jgi:hypothetical protein